MRDMFAKEGARAVLTEIEINENRLTEVRNAMKVLEFYAGNGLADGMPLGEAVGFWDV